MFKFILINGLLLSASYGLAAEQSARKAILACNAEIKELQKINPHDPEILRLKERACLLSLTLSKLIHSRLEDELKRELTTVKPTGRIPNGLKTKIIERRDVGRVSCEMILTLHKPNKE